MPRVSVAFFAVASVYAIIGMSWGMHMGATENHSMMPAHAHLNLLGLVVMAIYGTFYALAGPRLSARAAWTTFILANTGLVLLIPTLSLILANGMQPRYLPFILAGEFGTLLGMMSFAVSVFSLLLAKSGTGASGERATALAAE